MTSLAQSPSQAPALTMLGPRCAALRWGLSSYDGEWFGILISTEGGKIFSTAPVLWEYHNPGLIYLFPSGASLALLCCSDVQEEGDYES